MYRVQEFADLAGVTVRALHHYDRVALLRPVRTDSGYRVYSTRDLERLEQIVALKLLGLPLRDIKRLLDRDARLLPDVLRAQRRALEEKRRQLDRAIRAIADVERTLQAGACADTATLTRLIEVMEMQQNADHMKQYYSDDAWSALTRRRDEMRAAVNRGPEEWMELFRDIEAALDEDPASEKVQALVARWKALIDSFTGGNADIADGLKKAWTDRENWPATLRQASEPFSDQRVWAFICRASAQKR